jgi:hypothetical protein
MNSQKISKVDRLISLENLIDKTETLKPSAFINFEPVKRDFKTGKIQDNLRCSETARAAALRVNCR